MANDELFFKVRELKLPIGKFALFGSAPLGIRGLRAMRDVDIIVTEDLWKEYKTKPGWKYLKTTNGVEHITSGKIEIWHDWRPWYQTIENFIKDAEIINGLPFVKLKYFLEWKKAWARDKDLKDIKILETYLVNNNLQIL